MKFSNASKVILSRHSNSPKNSKIRATINLQDIGGSMDQNPVGRREREREALVSMLWILNFWFLN